MTDLDLLKMASTKTSFVKTSNSVIINDAELKSHSESSSSEDTSGKVSLTDLKLSWYSVESTQYDPENETKVAVLYTGGTIGMKSHGKGK